MHVEYSAFMMAISQGRYTPESLKLFYGAKLIKNVHSWCLLLAFNIVSIKVYSASYYLRLFPSSPATRLLIPLIETLS